MNYRMIFYMVGRLLQLEAALLLLPAVVCVVYGDGGLAAMLISAGVALLVGTGLTLLRRPKNHTIYAKEGFIIVALSWVALSLVGALPFVLSGEIPRFVDAFFETVSGFTTTGSSVVTDLGRMGETLGMSHGVLFWRSFTHWIGGMGVLVLMMALSPSQSGRTIHVMRAEVPGPIVGKLVPRLRDTAKILYLLYLVLTVVEVLCLLVAGMPLFDSLIHTFGTAGTGGFGMYSTSIGEYNAACQWIITVFMWLFGVNFNIYYLLLIRSFRSAFTNRELWAYFGITVAAIGAVSLNVALAGDYATVGETVRHAAFQASSIITTTGYATTDFNLWPMFAKCVLVLLMFIGASAGSTGGGLKVSRVMLVGKAVGRELKRLVHPRSVGVIRLEGKRVEEPVVQSATAYVALYFLLFGAAFLLLCLEPLFDLESNFTAVAACINNIGPGLGAVGPTGSFADYSALSKVVLSFAMLLGRLEIYPLVLALMPGTWTKR
ncbi:MAG: TrkH family potassium uptake protein [Ruminococcaceae bacterium]|nr:TrkH family potassium uptake protein [Oscillospiraceae bacterium]